jgi:hypothetical protein
LKGVAKKMDENLIKQAYAYGSAVALQELGYDARQAELGGIKLAAAKIAEGEEAAMMEQGAGRPENPSGVLPTLFGGLGGLAAPSGKKWRGYAGAEAGGQLGGAAGLAGGSLAGAGIGALVNALTKGRLSGSLARRISMGGKGMSGPLEPTANALRKGLLPGLGAIGGSALGGMGGLLYGRNKGYHAAVDPREGVDY